MLINNDDNDDDNYYNNYNNNNYNNYNYNNTNNTVSALILLRHLTVCLINTICTSLKLTGSRTNCWELETFLLEDSSIHICDVSYQDYPF